jgi:hypothetical protein
VALPETIPVKRTEEEAEFVSVRPVVRQTFRIEQLVDMLLAVTGKELPRLQQILRSGTVVYHYYRYWWTGFEAAAEDLRELLAKFPDADASREFRAEACTKVAMERAETHAAARQAAAEVERDAASKKRLFRGRSLWDCLMDAAREETPRYQTYSYMRRADIYVLELGAGALELAAAARERLARDIERLAPRDLRGPLRHVLRAPGIVNVLYICPR